MAVSLELHNTGDSNIGAEIQALVEHYLSDRSGGWRGSSVGSRETAKAGLDSSPSVAVLLGNGTRIAFSRVPALSKV